MQLHSISAQSLRIVFFGTPVFVTPVVRALHRQGWPIAAVVTAPERAVGRQRVMTPSPVATVAHELGIPVHTPTKLDDAFFAQFTELKPDLCIVAAYNKIIPQRILEIPRMGFINIHPSLLPAYRGPSPVRTAILDGVTESGVSIMVLDKEMDHGPILAQQPWTIPTGLDAPAAEQEALRIGSDLLLQVLPELVAGKTIPQVQDHTQATYSKKFTREDGKLDWTGSAKEIYNRIRALADNPGTWTVVEGKILNILEAHLADGKLVIDRVQPEGGKPMDWESFLRGHPNAKLG